MMTTPVDRLGQALFTSCRPGVHIGSAPFHSQQSPSVDNRL